MPLLWWFRIRLSIWCINFNVHLVGSEIGILFLKRWKWCVHMSSFVHKYKLVPFCCSELWNSFELSQTCVPFQCITGTERFLRDYLTSVCFISKMFRKPKFRKRCEFFYLANLSNSSIYTSSKLKFSHHLGKEAIRRAFNSQQNGFYCYIMQEVHQLDLQCPYSLADTQWKTSMNHRGTAFVLLCKNLLRIFAAVGEK